MGHKNTKKEDKAPPENPTQTAPKEEPKILIV